MSRVSVKEGFQSLLPLKLAKAKKFTPLSVLGTVSCRTFTSFSEQNGKGELCPVIDNITVSYVYE